MTVYLVCGGFMILLFIAGLVIDAGGTGLATRERASDLAAQAARAGAGQISEASLRTGDPADLRIDPAAAAAAGQRLLTAAGATGTITVTGPTTVQATAHVTHRTAILSAFGYDSVSATITSTATVLHGVRTGTR